ncbi:MAG TPA: hypothetical protein VE890_03900 [Thermoguttaceae bacterium]|nr:hypothetical protein [Thermoguttaceae bacterium]
MTDFSPLFAFNVGDVIPVVIFIIIAIISLLGNILNKGGNKQRPRGGGRPAPPRQKPAGEQLVDEIGEFLRKAADQGRGQQKQAGQQARQPRPRPVRAEPVQVQVVDDVPVGEGIERQVSEHLGKERLARQAAQLGSEVSRSDKKIDERLHTVFDHDVSGLARRPGKTARATLAEQPQTPEDRTDELPSTAAAGLAALFSNAQNIRQAIIINEVLTRPVDRWT